MGYYQSFYGSMLPPSFAKGFTGDNLLSTANLASYKFMYDFPRARNYTNMKDIIETFPHLRSVNKNELDIKKIADAKCFVLRSNNDDDIHKV